MSSDEYTSEPEDARIIACIWVVAAAGSVDLAAQQIAYEYEVDMEEAESLSTLAARLMIETAPAQISASFAHVCAYHNFREISRRSMAKNDLKTALQAQTEISKLLSGAQ